MKRMIPIILCMPAVSIGVFAQTTAEIIERALAAAPRQMRDGATVVKWNTDYTYETLKKGTNRLLCYDRSGEPGRQPFAVQCTSIANLESGGPEPEVRGHERHGRETGRSGCGRGERNPREA